MILAKAIAHVERLFTVHDEIGRPAPWTDQDNKTVGEGAVDMTVAPNGEAYVSVSSFGVEAELPSWAIAMFQSESLAFQWWVDEVRDYASSVESDTDRWKQLHLYWRTKPEFHKATYLVMDQASLMQTASPLSAILQIDLGFVTSQMLISKTNPDGKEG